VPTLRHCPLAAAFLSLAIPAQDINITNANVTFRAEFNATAMVYVATADFLRADPASDPAGVLFKTAWAYRLDGQTREFIFNDGGGQAVYSNAGPLGTATWANVDNLGRISAVATYLALPQSATSGVVVARMAVTNTSASNVTLNLFHLADMDLCGAAYATNVSTPGSNGHQAHTGSCAETCDHYAAGADRWEVGTYTNDLYTQLEDTMVTNLANTAASFGPADIRGAFQWQDRVLHPGQTETFTVTLAHNVSACPHAYNVFGSSMAGSLGAPTLSGGNAMLGTTLTIGIANARPSALGILALGFGRASTMVGDLTLHVAAPATFALPLSGTGTASMNVNVPNNMSYCGLPLVGEAFVLGDPTTQSTSGLPVTHSRGSLWVVGMY
jgi:hypothetical protein